MANNKKFAVQQKSHWQGDTWETVDYFDTKPEAEAKAAAILRKNTGDVKSDVMARVVKKVISYSELESIATRDM